MKTPFSVMMTLKTPIILSPDAWLTLDALLASQVYLRTQNVDRAHDEIPLARMSGLDDHGMPVQVWHGSAAFFNSVSKIGDASFKRSVEVREQYRAPYTVMRGGRFADKPSPNQQIDQIRGPFGAIITHYPVLSVEWVRWYGLGDKDAVEDLLADVQFIGKKHHQGYGEVSSILVEDAPEDWSIQSNVAGKVRVMRPIPVDLWASSGRPHPASPTIMPAAIDAPYFASPKRRCLVPHTRQAFWEASR